MTVSSARYRTFALVLLLANFALYLHDLWQFPLFVDEVIHIAWARDTLLGHPLAPFYEGKYLMGAAFAVFWPFVAGGWVAHMVTVLAGMLGLAALLGLGGLLIRRRAALLAGVFVVLLPMRYFFGRMALADPLAMSLLLVMLWGVAAALRRQSRAAALVGGMALALLTLTRLTHAVFLIVPVFGALLLCRHPRQAVPVLGWLYGAAAATLLPFGVLGALAGDIGLGHAATLLNTEQTLPVRFLFNARTAWNWLSGAYMGLPLLIGGLGGLLWAAFRRRRALLFIAAPALLLAGALFAVVRLPVARYYLLLTPALLLLASALIWRLADWLAQHITARAEGLGWLAILLSVHAIPFIATYHTHPAALPLPITDRSDYIIQITAGFGLDAAAEWVADYTATQPHTTIVCLAQVVCDWLDINQRARPGVGYARVDYLTTEQPTGRATLVVLNEPAWDKTYSLPPDLPLVEAARFERPGDVSAVVIYRVQPSP